MSRKPGEPKDFQVRICYWLDGERFYEDFWTTKTIADGLIEHERGSTQFARALRSLNYQMRYRAGYPPRGDNFRFEIMPRDVVGKPELSARKERLSHIQQRFEAAEITKKTIYLLPPIRREPRKKKEVNKDQGQLFRDF